MIRNLFWILLCLWSAAADAGHSFAVKSGVHFSNLIRLGEDVETGLTFGIRQESIRGNTGWILEILFATQYGVIRDKSVGWYGYNENIPYYDIIYRRLTMHLPMSVKREFRITRSVRAGIILGVCLSVGIRNTSELKLLRTKPYPNPSQQSGYDHTNFDLDFCHECAGGDNPLSINSGLELRWRRWSVEFRVPLPYHPIGKIRNVIVQERYQVLHVLMGYYF